VTGAGILMVLGHFYLAILPQAGEGYETVSRAVFGLILFGVAFSFYTTSLWPCVPYIFPI